MLEDTPVKKDKDAPEGAAVTRHTAKTLNLSAATRQGLAPSSSTPALPAELAARFEALGVLGRGGAGVVLRAKDRLVGREVAIKLLGDAFRDKSKILQVEATHLAGLEHDRVVRLYEFGLAGDTGYLVMELVRGETLWARLARGRPPLLEGLAVGIDLCEGLMAAHARGLVHSDIKPLNVFVDAQGRIKIADFGLARQIHAEVDERPLAEEVVGGDVHTSPTQSGGLVGKKGPVLGTPGYMAPEQADGLPPTPASDIYAAGVVIHETLTGQKMFSGRTPLALLVEQQRGPKFRVGELNPGVPAGLDELVMRCLATDPAERPTAEVLGRELAMWADRLRRASRQPRAAGFPPHPYKFLDHFEADDAVIYFGRESEVAELGGILGSDGVRMAMVFGPCGVGKSSLLRAGLRRALDPAHYDVTTVIAGADPAGTVTEALKARAARSGESTGIVRDELDSAYARVARALRVIARNTGRTPVVVIDQLEEVFTLNPGGSDHAGRFFELVCELVERADVPLKLVLSFRTEFRGQLFELERRLARYTHHYMVGEMGEPALAEAIEGPSWIESYGFGYETGFARRLARDILATVQERGETAPPVLQIVCRQLFDRARKEGVKTIGAALYERALGGARGALSRYVEERLDGPAYGQSAVLARQMLRALTLGGDGGERFARSREESDLLDFPDRVAAKRTLEQLLADRLVVREQKAHGVIHVRLASEVICPLVEAWGPEVDEAERAARLLARCARQWLEHGRKDEDLLTGGGLELVERQHGALREQDPGEKELYVASLAARRARRVRVGIGGGVVALFAAFIVWATFVRPGTVTITSEPRGAEVVRDDGTVVGSTPVTFSSWPGTHQLTLRRERYGDVPLTVRVPAGGAVSYSPLLPYPYGLLAISSDPPGARCEIRVKGASSTTPTKVVSATTPFYQELPAGSYALKLSAPAYSESEVEVDVAANRVLAERVVRLERNTGSLRVSCPFPGTAMVVRDAGGRQVWTATLPAAARELPVGQYQIEAGGPGHKREVRSVEVTKWATTVCTAWTPPVTRVGVLARGGTWNPAAVEDVDGDGRPDVIAVSGTTRLVVRSPVRDALVADVPLEQTFDVTRRSKAAIVGVKTGDLNGDGRADALCWCNPDVMIAVDLKAQKVLQAYMGVGSGPGASPGLADFDGDGAADVLMPRAEGEVSAESVKLGKQLWLAKTPTEIMATACADLDGDGRAEVVLYGVDDTLRALSGTDGKVIWQRKMSPKSSGMYCTLVAADLLGKRGKQLLWTEGYSVVALDAKGEPLWTRQFEGAPGGAPREDDARGDYGGWLLATADLDGDGRIDPVSYGYGTVLSLDGRDGRVRWRAKDKQNRWGALATDLDGDGRAELVFQRDDALVEVRSGADGALQWTVRGSELHSAPLMAVDWDGDGMSDVLHLDERAEVVVDSGAFVPVEWAFRIAGPAITPPSMADVDGDGVLDAVTFARSEGHAVVQAVSGRTGRELWASRRAAPTSAKLAFADLDGDGGVDVLAPAEHGVIALSGKTGRPLWSGATHLAFVEGISVAKVDRDAVMDAIVCGLKDPQSSKHEYAALSGATGRVLWTTGELTGSGAHAPVMLDVDRDGIPEVVAGEEKLSEDASESTTGEPAMDNYLRLINVQSGVVEPFGKSYTAAGTTVFQTGDFDGDGRTDALTVSEDGMLITFASRLKDMYWEVDSDPAGQTFPRPTMGTVSITDVDGDRAADVLVCSGGRVWALSGRTSKPLWDHVYAESPLMPLGLWRPTATTLSALTVTRNGSVLQLDGKTGKAQGTLRMKSALIGPPIIFDPSAKTAVTEDDMTCPRTAQPTPATAKVAWFLDQETLLMARLSDLLPRKR